MAEKSFRRTYGAPKLNFRTLPKQKKN